MKKILIMVFLGFLLSGCVVNDAKMNQINTETVVKLEAECI